MTLLIISHTEHYVDESGQVVGWSATVNEIDALAAIFDKVIHVACLYALAPPGKMSAYSHPNVEFVAIPPYGGRGFKKFSVLYFLPVIVYRVFRALKRATVFQFRAPTSMGVFLIPLLTVFTRKKGWYKYAGNWNHPRPPASYAFQRFFLTYLQRRKVTINGRWPNQWPHCLSFENPCLTESDLACGKEVIAEKRFQPPYTIVFVGRLVEHKGVHLLFEALTSLAGQVDKVHIIGDGAMKSFLEERAEELASEVFFHGFLERTDLFNLLKESHLIVLPSESEGFPKVIAEGWNFGCVPVVTDVSSVGQYVSNGLNGYLIPAGERNAYSIVKIFHTILESRNLSQLAEAGSGLCSKFLYSFYLERLQREVIQHDRATKER